MTYYKEIIYNIIVSVYFVFFLFIFNDNCFTFNSMQHICIAHIGTGNAILGLCTPLWNRLSITTKSRVFNEYVFTLVCSIVFTIHANTVIAYIIWYGYKPHVEVDHKFICDRRCIYYNISKIKLNQLHVVSCI